MNTPPSKPLVPPRAVIFDLDGVITDTAQYHFHAWQRLAISLGLPFDEAFNESLKGIDRMGSLDRILARGGKVYSPQQKLALARQKNEHYIELISTMDSAQLLPGALQALCAVRAAGLRIGLASASRNAALVLTRLGITRCFDHVVEVAEIERPKPDPEIFLTAAQRLGVRPVQCIGVEDAAAGVAAIKGAGMWAVGIGDAEVLSHADEVISGLDQFDIQHYL
ncbi:beta-phosphoglucomutase [Aquincola sp. S2]|uniref:Beta-phosphoglucomutase n=1 Tax=Pseudaquabacterium terrae TaxID=2732868 RepID=A0ABX2EUJ6_9BURK|nr:beta-phosphoglucomutase [Aquabacterium terrae]NRF72145.1 beta-phosphoglucomutase [Aquabacterium terrae]